MTLKDIIARATTLGEVLKMVPDIRVDDDIIAKAREVQVEGEMLGDVLIRMGVINNEQLGRALVLQKKMRMAKNFEELEPFFNDVRKACEDARDTLFAAIPDTVPGHLV